MSDAEYLFQESIREKRGMVNGAKHTVGKTRRNGRPKDLDVSQKEYNAKCGQVQKFNMAMPMSLREFKELPIDLQKEYFRRLVEILHMNRAIISMMMGCSYPVVASLMEKCGYKYNAVKGRKFNEYHNDWYNFFNRDERFAHIMDSFYIPGEKKHDHYRKQVIKETKKTHEDPAEETNTQVSTQELVKKTPEDPIKTPDETTQVSTQESVKKTPEVLSMSIRIYADSYDELISQLETMRGQPIMGKTLTIEVVKG